MMSINVHKLYMISLLICLIVACGGAEDTPPATDTADADAADTSSLPDAQEDAAAEEDAAAAADADAADAAADAEEEDPYGLTDAPLPAAPWSVYAPGRYGVGFRTLEARYTPAGSDAERVVPVSVWYPTRATRGPAARYSRIVSRAGVFADAPLASGPPRPLLVFSMGHMGFAEQSYFFTEFFASHGWIVAAPTHTGNTILDPGPRPPAMFEWRPQDISRALDLLLEGLAADDPLRGAIQPEQVAISGHSYGGYTTLALVGARFDVEGLAADCSALGDEAPCAYTQAALPRYAAGFAEPRFKAAIPMAPGNSRVFAGGGAGEVAVPVLHMTGALDRSVREESEATPLWEALPPGAAWRLHFPTGGHQTFANGCELLPGSFRDDGCGPDFIPWQEAHPVINAAALAFLRWQVQADPGDAAIFEGAVPLHPDAEVWAR